MTLDAAIHLTGARVIDPATGLDEVTDLWVDGDAVRRAPVEGVGYREHDVAGRVVAPAFVEIHAHLREPGGEESETIASGLRAARAGGFGHVLAMANTTPTNDDPAVTGRMLAAADAAQTGVRLYPVSAVSKGLQGREAAPWREQVEAGCVALSDDGRPVADGALLEEVLAACVDLGVPYLSHAECPELFTGAVHAGVAAEHLGIPGIPTECESRAVKREIAVAERLGAPLHICHISTEAAITAVREARARGARVSAEATPHHLLLTDDSLLAHGPDPLFKMNPPLRTAHDVVALRAALLDGAVGAVATDHAPHPEHRKCGAIERAAFGVIGMETAFPVLHQRLVVELGWPLELLIERLTSGPAGLVGLPAGRLFEGPPSLVVIDPAAAWRIEPERFRSKSRNCPFDGWRGAGTITAVLLDGRLETAADPGR
jgi:dihydroorotase